MSDLFQTEDRIDDPLVRAQGSPALPATWDAGVGSFFEFSDNWIPKIYRVAQAETRLWTARLLTPIYGERVADRELTAQEATERYGGNGLVTFDGPVTEWTAQDRLRLAQRAQQRASYAERAKLGIGGNLAGFGLSVGGSLLDPLEVAASFVPVVREARMARWLARAGSSAARRAGVRAGAGAIEGVVGAAAFEPLNAFLTLEEGQDYSAGMSLTNIAVGGVLGVGLHTAVGGVADLVGKPRPRKGDASAVIYDDAGGGPAPVAAVYARETPRTPAAIRAARAEPRVRAEALDRAINQLEDDAPVDVKPTFDAADAREGRAVDAGEEGLPELKARPLREATAYTPSGRSVAVRYAIVELDDLITSHNDGLMVNPAYPAAMQPRERGRAASEVQVGEISRKLNPDLLLEGAGAGEGAPIVSSRGIVESGNGRTIALRRSRDEGTYERYRQALTARGYDVSGFKHPVVVRIRTEDLKGNERLAFGREANASATARMSPAEQARADAAALTDDVLALHAGGEITLAANRPFALRFIDSVVTAESERGELYDANKRLLPKGHERMRAALFAKAYDDPQLIALATELEGGDLKKIAGALEDVAPLWAQMRADMRAGLVSADLDVTAEMTRALWLVQKAREERRPLAWYIELNDLVQPHTPEMLGMLQLFFNNEALTSQASRPKIAAALTHYATEARKRVAGPALFEDTSADAGPLAVIAAAARRASGVVDEPNGNAAPGGPEAAGGGAEPARVQPVADGSGGQPQGDSGGAGNEPDLSAAPAPAPKRKPKAKPEKAAPVEPVEDAELADLTDTLGLIAAERDAAELRLSERAAQLGLTPEKIAALSDEIEAIQLETGAIAEPVAVTRQRQKQRQSALKAAATCLASQNRGS